MNNDNALQLNNLYAKKAQVEENFFEIDGFIKQLKESKVKLLDSRKILLNELGNELLGRQIKKEPVEINEC